MHNTGIVKWYFFFFLFFHGICLWVFCFQYFLIFFFFFFSFPRSFQFIIFASAICCTAFAYPGYEEYQFAGHDLSSHGDESVYESTGHHPVAAQRISVHEIGGHDDEHVDYYVSENCSPFVYYLIIIINCTKKKQRRRWKKMFCGILEIYNNNDVLVWSALSVYGKQKCRDDNDNDFLFIWCMQCTSGFFFFTFRRSVNILAGESYRTIAS